MPYAAVKAGAIALALLIPADATSSTQTSRWVFYPYVEQVVCDNSFGTAFRIGHNRLLSVDHVTSHTGCTVDNEPITVELADPELDFSIALSARPGPNIVKYSCAGIKAGEWVYAIGHAKGWPRQQMIALVSRGWKHPDGMAILHGNGTVIPGMSGGPVINAAGEVVATVNAYNPWINLSFVRELKDTPLCQPKGEKL
jgi:hypothetical protein